MNGRVNGGSFDKFLYVLIIPVSRSYEFRIKFVEKHKCFYLFLIRKTLINCKGGLQHTDWQLSTC